MNSGADETEVVVVVEDRLPCDGDPENLVPLVRFALGEEGARGPWNVVIALCGDSTLRNLHREFMGIDSETDVMTFPLSESSPTGGGGDIVISIERAAEQAADWNHSPWEEVRFLVVHGVLHLSGWDDSTSADRERMMARQAEIIARFDRVNA